MVARKVAEWGTSIWEFELYGPAASNPGDLPYAQVFTAQPTPTPIPCLSLLRRAWAPGTPPRCTKG